VIFPVLFPTGLSPPPVRFADIQKTGTLFVSAFGAISVPIIPLRTAFVKHVFQEIRLPEQEKILPFPHIF